MTGEHRTTSGHVDAWEHIEAQRVVPVVPEPMLVPDDLLRTRLQVAGLVRGARHRTILTRLHPWPRHLETGPDEPLGRAEQCRHHPWHLRDPSSGRDESLHGDVDARDRARPRPGAPAQGDVAGGMGDLRLVLDGAAD